jgi:hypothetical protein
MKKPVVLEANSLRLTDMSGKERIVLQANSSVDDIAGIWLKDVDGNTLLEIQISKNSATVRMANADGSNAVQMGASELNNGITVSNCEGESAVSIGVERAKKGPVSANEGYVMVRDCKSHSFKILTVQAHK